VRLARITKWQPLTDGQYKFPIPDVIGKFPHFRWFRCIKGRYRTILASTRCPNEQTHSPRFHVPASPLRCEIIELCVRWYITYRLSYRDLAAMMAERGIIVSHTTILRWVIRHVPEFEKRWNRFARPVNTSWRVDETYINIRGK
jgi:hypothetical protein